MEYAAEIDFEVFLGDGIGALKIETPLHSIGQDAPAKLATRDIVDFPKLAENLVRRYPGVFEIGSVAAIQNSLPALSLHDASAVTKSARASFRRRLVFRFSVAE